MTILVQAALFPEPELLLVDGAADIFFEMIPVVGGAQLANGVTDHLYLAKSGDPAEGVVDLEDDAVVIHHNQPIVGIKGYLGQPQGIVGGEALEFDGGPLVLAAQ